MDSGLSKILCIEPDLRLLESRAAVLKHSGFDVKTAPPPEAETVLRDQEFDLLIVHSVDESDLHRVAALSNGAEVLILEGYTSPIELVALVADRLKPRSNIQPKASIP